MEKMYVEYLNLETGKAYKGIVTWSELCQLFVRYEVIFWCKENSKRKERRA